MTTGEFARIMRITKETLFHYDEIGLFQPELTQPNGYRYYSIYQTEILDTILLLKDIGMPLKEIKKQLVNRAPAKVQSALLEAMQERQVTISENTYRLPSPFLVMATQNPIEQEGTYPLPEAQVDRFMLKVIINYPKKEEEKLIIRQNISGVKPDIKPILTKEEILEARKVVREVYLDEKIERYIVDIVFATRFPQEHGLANLANMISFGASTRASISLALAARAYAFIKRRGYVIPEDIRAVCHDVMRHRIGLSYEAEANNLTSEEVISEILNKVEVP